MSKTNPTGKPLSGPTRGGARTYRPKKKGSKRRPRIRVPEGVAEKLEDAAQETVKRRREVAVKAAGKKKVAKKTAKKAAKRTPTKAKTKALATVEAEPQLDLFATRNPMRRGPVDLECLRDAYELGDLSLLEWDHGPNREQVECPDGKCPLLWAPACNAAFFFMGKTRVSAGEPGTASSVKGRERWQGSRSSGTYTFTAVGLLSKKVAWKQVGIGFQIAYWSDKRGKRERHVHPFDKGRVKLYNLGNLFLLRGGRLRATSRGLEG